jgi:hypothetical protein
VAEATEDYFYEITNEPGSPLWTYTAISAKEGVTLIGQTSWVFNIAQLTEQCAPKNVQCTTLDGNVTTNLDTSAWNTAYVPSGESKPGGSWQFVDGGLALTNADSNSKVSWTRAANFDLKNTGELNVDYTHASGNLSGGPGVNLFVDFDNDGTYDGTLVFEEVYGQDLWLTNGSGADIKANAPSHTGGNGSENHGTINQWLTVYPDAKVIGIAFAYGTGGPSSGTLHSFTTGCTTYSFDYEQPPAPPTKDPMFTEWVDEAWVCGDETTDQTRTRTDYAAPVWDPETKVWVEDTVGTPTIETRTRDLTDEEIKEWQTADPNGECYNRPDAPDPNKGSRTVITCTSVIDYTWDITPVWNEETGQYDMVKGSEVASSPRTPTAAELKVAGLTCTTPPPPPTCPSGTTWTDSNHDGKVTSNECTTPPTLASTGFDLAGISGVAALVTFIGAILMAFVAFVRRRGWMAG